MADSEKKIAPGLASVTRAGKDGAVPRLDVSPWTGDLELTLVVYTKYASPAKAEVRLQASEIPACMFTVGVMLPTWNLEMMIKSRMILTANLTELMISGTSGLSSARVDVEIAYSTAELNAENAEMRIYVTLTSLTSTGTKPCAKVEAPATNPILMTSPRSDWKRIRV